jgi:hypothetical protein
MTAHHPEPTSGAGTKRQILTTNLAANDTPNVRSSGPIHRRYPRCCPE